MRPGGLARGPRGLIDQGMTDVVAPESEPPEEMLLERQDHGQAIDRGREPPSPSRAPGPELRRNVVEHLGPRLSRRLGHADVKARVVDQDDEVVAVRAKVGPERSQQPEVGAELGHHLYQTEGRQPLHRVPDRSARRGHPGAAERLDERIRMARAERLDDAGAVEVARGLAGGDEDARGGSCDHPTAGMASGDVRTASATRSARASALLPSSPLTTTSRSPRTAFTKLRSSSWSASASGASSITRSTTSVSALPVPGRQSPRTRMNSPPPLARSSDR